MALKVGRGASAPPFIVMDVIAAANARQTALPPGAPHVIRMEVGQPGTGAPAGAVAAARRRCGRAIRSATPRRSAGRSLRERIAAHYRDWYGLDVAADRIAVTVGASGAFPLAFLAAFDPGDRVALAAPFYPPYVNILTALGMQPVILEAGPETRFQPTVAMLERLDPPPGRADRRQSLQSGRHDAAPGRTRRHRGLVRRQRRAADQRRDLSRPELRQPDRHRRRVQRQRGRDEQLLQVFQHDGLAHRLDGAADDLVRPVECLAQNLFISAPHISQIAAEAAFDCHDELQANVARYRRSRDHLLRTLPAAGFTRLRPAEGAFYLFADIADRTNDSAAFCARMLRRGGGRGDAGRGFRPHARQPVPALQLLRAGGGHARGGGTAGALAVAQLQLARHVRMQLRWLPATVAIE